MSTLITSLKFRVSRNFFVFFRSELVVTLNICSSYAYIEMTESEMEKARVLIRALIKITFFSNFLLE